MVAIDQMEGGTLAPRFVAGLLARPEPGLNETAAWIIGRHRDWAVPLAGVLDERLNRIDLPPAGSHRAGTSTGPVRAGRSRSSGCWPRD